MRLSIVSVTYNQPRLLERTLRSLCPLVGAGLEWEVIVVDSSPEINSEILDSFEQLPIRHVSQPPKGIYPAMNEGLKTATGEFVWFLNGGDELASVQALLHALGALERRGDAALLVAAAELWRNGVTQYTQTGRSGLLPMMGINRVCHQAMIYRRSLFETLGSFREQYRLAADYEFHLRAHQAKYLTLTLPETLARYDTGGQSSNPDRIFLEFRKVQEDLAKAGLLSHRWLHSFVRRAELLKIRSFRALEATWLGPALRKIWYKYKQITR